VATFLRSGIGTLRALAIHHRNAPLPLLERVALAAVQREALHARLRAHGIEAVVLSTCHRSELYYRAHTRGDDTRAEALWRAPLEDVDVEPARLTGRDAAEHLFRVAAGLESLVLGETEVLGQLRTALEAATHAGSAGPLLARTFHAALRCGGRARGETGIGAGALSIASAAVRLLDAGSRDLSSLTVLVLGAGATGLKVARHLSAEGVRRLVLLNRTTERARVAAEELEVEHAELSDLPWLLMQADAVVAAAQVERPLIDPAMVSVHAAREGAPLTLVDLSLPRAVDPACAAIPGVRVLNLADLEQVVAANRSRRESEIPRVRAIVARELEQLVRWASARSHRVQDTSAQPW
jgi:glutamyl-tRNA reductase